MQVKKWIAKGDFWLLEGLEESIMKGLSWLYLVNLKPQRGVNGAYLIYEEYGW